MRTSPRLVHVFPSFGTGGTELRISRVINALGPVYRHTILPLDGNSDAAARIDPSISCTILERPRVKSGLKLWLELDRMLRSAEPNLLLTYNWGSIDAILPARIGSICPVIHNESGFGADEATGLKLRRVLARRVLLNRIYATVVNSRTLLQIARSRYRIAPAKIRFIRNGIDIGRFRPDTNRELRVQLGLGEGELLFGFVGRFRPEKNLPFLLQAFAKAGLTQARLALTGSGPVREELASLASHLRIEDRVIFVPATSNPAPVFNAFDVFVMSSLTEQTPNALLEAMASGLPVVSTDVGDVRDLLGASGPPQIAALHDIGAYADCLRALAVDPRLRAETGTANRARCVENHSISQMSREFAELYEAAVSTSKTRNAG